MDLEKFNPQNHLFKITEGDLYRIVTILEDNMVSYTIDDKGQDSVILECKDYFQWFRGISNFLRDSSKVIRIFRNREHFEVEDMPFLEDNNFLDLGNSLEVNPFSGAWNYQDESGDFKEGILKYLQIGRKDYYRLSQGLKLILDFGSVSPNIFGELRENNNKFRTGLAEIYYSRLKIKVLTEKLLDDFLENDRFTRCIPFKEDSGCGYWTFSRRYIKNIDKNVFPPGKLILEDLETWETSLEKFVLGNNIEIPGINRIVVQYISGKFLQLLDRTKHCRSFYDIITAENYETYDEGLKEEIRLVFCLLKDRGYILGNSQEEILYNLKKWKDIGIV